MSKAGLRQDCCGCSRSCRCRAGGPAPSCGLARRGRADGAQRHRRPAGARLPRGRDPGIGRRVPAGLGRRDRGNSLRALTKLEQVLLSRLRRWVNALQTDTVPLTTDPARPGDRFGHADPHGGLPRPRAPPLRLPGPQRLGEPAVDEHTAFSTPAPTPSIRWPSTWGRSALTSQSASHPNSSCTSANFLIATTAPPTDEQRSPGAVDTLRPRHTDLRPTWRTPLSRSATAEAPVPMVSWEE
jgi:hypothetical protein